MSKKLDYTKPLWTVRVGDIEYKVPYNLIEQHDKNMIDAARDHRNEIERLTKEFHNRVVNWHEIEGGQDADD